MSQNVMHILDMELGKCEKTEMVMDVDQAVECLCKLHKKVELGGSCAKGCLAWKHGTHSVIRRLYADTIVKYCHTDSGTRVLDVMLARRSMETGNASYMGEPYGPLRKFMRGSAVCVADLGAGYCYLAAFYAVVRMRVARILGPMPLIVDVLRLLRVAGLHSFGPYNLEFVSFGVFHLEVMNGKIAKRGASLVNALLTVVKIHGGGSRIGVDERDSESLDLALGGARLSNDYAVVERFLSTSGVGSDVVRACLADREKRAEAVVVSKKVLRTQRMGSLKVELRGFLSCDYPFSLRLGGSIAKWLGGLDVFVEDSSHLMLELACTAPSDQESFIVGGRQQFKILSIYGDAALKMAAVTWASEFDTAVEVNALVQSFVTNDALAACVKSSGLAALLSDNYSAFSVKGYADCFEALIGVVYLFEGIDSAMGLALSLKVPL